MRHWMENALSNAENVKESWVQCEYESWFTFIMMPSFHVLFIDYSGRLQNKTKQLWEIMCVFEKPSNVSRGILNREYAFKCRKREKKLGAAWIWMLIHVHCDDKTNSNNPQFRISNWVDSIKIKWIRITWKILKYKFVIFILCLAIIK